MASVLSSFFQRDPKSQFPYDIPGAEEHFFDRVSIGNSFKKAEPGELATIFWDNRSSTLKQQAQKLKTMRHPNIITYLDSIELEGTFYLVTEKCKPLELYLKEAGLTESQKEFVVSWGMFQLLNALKFMHEAKLSHENLRKGVFVTAGGDWKIGGLHLVTGFTSPQTDLNQLAIVLWEVFNGFNDAITRPQAPGKIPQRIHELYKKIGAQSAARLAVCDIIKEYRLTGGYLKNKFVDTLLFLEEFELKEASEKQSFFMHLRENIDIFPEDVAKYKILPKLILTYEYGDAGPNILIPLFKLGRLLDEAEYQRTIVPCLCKLFGSPDRTTRVKLLERIDEFAPHLTPQILNDKIFGNLTSGFLDTNPAVRESTVKAMVSLAEKLNYNNLNVELMKYLARLQGGDEHGGIRTNTTICLGKIGHLIAPAKRQGILISAFTRALKDPFAPSRMASVLALSATQQFYPLVEISNRIVPSLIPLTCDPEKQVRDQAFKAIRGFLEKLEKASENPACIPELEAGVKAGASSILDHEKVPQWASWALKSLSGKFYKGPPPAEVKPGAPATADTSSRPVTPNPTAEKEKSSTVLKPTPAKPATNDGWGDLTDGGDMFAVKDSNDSAIDDWADINTKSNDADDWGVGWDTPIATATSSPIPGVKKSSSSSSAAAKKPTIGRLNLGSNLAGSSAQKQTKKAIDDNIDALLGISAPPAAGSSVKPNSLNALMNNSSSSTNTGWGFDDPLPTTNNSSANKGWDDDGWGDNSMSSNVLQPTAVLQPTKMKDDKDARRAEMQARNEARRKEQMDRKKSAGAMKLASVEKKMDDFADW
ncbi:Protein kinase domain-containing protein [Caenorhabditis elegans]|uniref:Protein kinase domain-containing protein n=1 Tax=Caenorhabditis elegans TaxID=6239 RepID=Q23215_CAEEL|nr:Protein kinase domain-containing protein [Caenorhabditis elegans]CAB01444.2 Protein kinase domain-containing protein [Caenorhabditis elegans]|eukprot:NP_506259.2 Uncharacterized protein CELE_W07G4.3 [Caenorhabditis elegans]